MDEGSEVKKGDLIAELDPAELQAALPQDEANIASLEAKVNAVQPNAGLDRRADSALPSIRRACDVTSEQARNSSRLARHSTAMN